MPLSWQCGHRRCCLRTGGLEAHSFQTSGTTLELGWRSLFEQDLIQICLYSTHTEPSCNFSSSSTERVPQTNKRWCNIICCHSIRGRVVSWGLILTYSACYKRKIISLTFWSSIFVFLEVLVFLLTVFLNSFTCFQNTLYIKLELTDKWVLFSFGSTHHHSREMHLSLVSAHTQPGCVAESAFAAVVFITRTLLYLCRLKLCELWNLGLLKGGSKTLSGLPIVVR